MKSVFILRVCVCVCVCVCVFKTMCFYLKWCVKRKKNTKSQPKKIVYETVNFGSTMLTKPIKNFLETQKNDTIFS